MKWTSYGFVLLGIVVLGCSDDDATTTTSTGTGGDGGAGAVGGAGATGGEGGSGGSDTLGELDEVETALARSMSPLPALPSSPTNKYADDPDAAALGQKFYFEADWAGPLAIDSDLGDAGEEGKVSCRSCHDSDTFDSPDNVAVGANYHPRHAPGSVNAAFYVWPTWRGRFDSLWALPRAVFEAGAIFASSRLRVAHVVYDQYQAEYDAVFDTPLDPRLDPSHADAADFPDAGKPGDAAWDDMAAADQEIVNVVMANVGKALEAYQRQLVMGASRFDAFVAETGSLTSEEQNGFKLFVGKAGCVECHSGAFFSDQSFRNLGLEQTGPNVPATDEGRYNVIDAILADPWNGAGAYSDDVTAGQAQLDTLEDKTDDLIGRFRVPTVRNVELNAPYMHAGQVATLEELVDFYDAGGGNGTTGTKDALLVPLNLTADEKADLVAFLKALTGEPIPTALTEDTSN
jgi:cytochrome c peroxidase